MELLFLGEKWLDGLFCFFFKEVVLKSFLQHPWV